MTTRSWLWLLLFVSLASAAGCEREDRLLLGDWRAVSATQGGDSLRLDPTEITFTFRPDNRYLFNSTLRYHEAGTWRYQNGFLMARDTTKAGNDERVVAVDLLTPDSLLIRMRADTAERRVLLLKE